MHHLIFVCNALDDATRLERGIVTDSPAASRKIFLLSQTLQNVGIKVHVLSLGRGRQNGSCRYFHAKVVPVQKIPVIYLPFIHTPVISELFSMFSLIPVIWRMRKRNGKGTVIFYNRMPAYLLGLILARVLGFKTVLDLEDGETQQNKWSPSNIRSRIWRGVFDAFCSGGALIACSALGKMTILRPAQCCYGVVQPLPALANWDALEIHVLLGGTVSRDTGAQLLMEVVRLLREEKPAWAEALRFNVTGKGDCIEELRQIASNEESPALVVHGRMIDEEYQSFLSQIHVGLALKPTMGDLAQTTFPSKVIEFASQGILVVTTDISDVREVLADGALYLEEDDPRLLIEKLRWITENREAARKISLTGQRRVLEVCSPETMGPILRKFLFDCVAEPQV